MAERKPEMKNSYMTEMVGTKVFLGMGKTYSTVTVEGGHIVINKGYSENSEKYKVL